MEVTFTVPSAAHVIEELLKTNRRAPQVVIGAGTVLDPETARIAMLAGAQFVVAPALNVETARMYNRYPIPYFPGAATVAK